MYVSVSAFELKLLGICGQTSGEEGLKIASDARRSYADQPKVLPSSITKALILLVPEFSGFVPEIFCYHLQNSVVTSSMKFFLMPSQ